jgi:hypothetical protein
MSEVFEQVMALCARGSFTGLLRVQTREGNGEVRFLSGIQDGVRFETLSGDAALARLEAASEHEFEAIASLPPIDPSSPSPVPIEGGLDRLHAAQLMRYCESNSLTCALELEAGGRMLTARYRLGELLSVEPDSELTAQLAEAKQGLYRFKLPRFELPASTRARHAAAATPASAGTPAAAPVAARPAAPAAHIGTPPSASVATRPAAPNAAAALEPAAAPAVQPVRIAPVHMRPTPAATPAAGRALVPASGSVSSARTPAAAPAAARAAAGPAAAARPAAAAAEPPRAAPAAEPLRPAPVVTPAAAPRSPAPAAAASPAPAARPAAASPAPAEKAPAPKAPLLAAAAPAPNVAARSPQSNTGEGRFAASAARPAAARQPPPAQPRERSSRSGLLIVMALVALGLVAWVLLGSPLPGP